MPRLLVVDDDPAVREFVHDFFSVQGYEVIEVATGLEGLQCLRDERPHLILLDIRLPDSDGLEVLRKAKAIDPGVGVVMLTGMRDEAIGRQALRAGAFDFITKPVDLKHLERVVWYKTTEMTIA